MGAGRRTETHKGSHRPTRSSEAAPRSGSNFLHLPPQKLAAVIFGCTHKTFDECMKKTLFGLRHDHIAYVRNVRPGMPLFLFNYSDRMLHGIFEAASHGQIDIYPQAWSNNSGKTPFPAQVLVRVKERCPSLPEFCFKQAISHNYYAEKHFANELDEIQTKNLIRLFKEGAPQRTLVCKSAQQEDEAESDGSIKPKKTAKPGKKAWQNARCVIPAAQQSSALELVSTEDTHNQCEEPSTEAIFSGKYHMDSVADVEYASEGGHNGSFNRKDDVEREASSGNLIKESTDSADDLLSCQSVLCCVDLENKQPCSEGWEQKGYGKQNAEAIYSGKYHTDSVADVEYAWKEDHSGSSKWKDNVEREVSSSNLIKDESADDLLSCGYVSLCVDKESEQPGSEGFKQKGYQKTQQQESLHMLGTDTTSEFDVNIETKELKFTYDQVKDLQKRELEEREIPACLPKEQEIFPAELSASENQMTDGCVQEQVLQGSEYNKTSCLYEEDASAATISQENLELPTNMERKGTEENICVCCHAKQAVLLSEIDQLQKKNAILEQKQGHLFSEVEDLKQQMTHLSLQLETSQQKCIYTSGSNSRNERIVEGISDEKMACTGCDQNIYLLGGSDEKLWLRAADMINPDTFEAVPIAPMVYSRSYAAASVLMGQIYVFGGGNGEVCYETAEFYNTNKKEWALCSSMSIKRGSLAAATLGDRIYALGGGNGQVDFSEVECYDAHIGMWIASHSMLNKRSGVGAAELDGALYAIGGYNSGQHLRSVERYDPRDGHWTSIASLQHERGSLSVAVLGGQIYAIGGYDGAAFLNSVEFYESRVNKWLEMENRMQFERSCGSAVVIGDRIFMLGGYAGGRYIQTIEQYHVSTGWSIVQSAVLGKSCFHSGVVL